MTLFLDIVPLEKGQHCGIVRTKKPRFETSPGLKSSLLAQKAVTLALVSPPLPGTQTFQFCLQYRKYVAALIDFPMPIYIFCAILYFTRSWQALHFAVAGACTFGLPLLVFYLPESPRWLVMKNRKEEAMEIFLKVGSLAKQNKTIQPREQMTKGERFDGTRNK